jgi:hypothetical protein
MRRRWCRHWGVRVTQKRADERAAGKARAQLVELCQLVGGKADGQAFGSILHVRQPAISPCARASDWRRARRPRCSTNGEPPELVRRAWPSASISRDRERDAARSVRRRFPFASTVDDGGGYQWDCHRW